jgi:hypothetical protein
MRTLRTPPTARRALEDQDDEDRQVYGAVRPPRQPNHSRTEDNSG